MLESPFFYGTLLAVQLLVFGLTFRAFLLFERRPDSRPENAYRFFGGWGSVAGFLLMQIIGLRALVQESVLLFWLGTGLILLAAVQFALNLALRKRLQDYEKGTVDSC